MTTWARVSNGVVVETIGSDPAGRFNAALIWAPCPAGTLPGDTFDGTTFAHPAVTTPPAVPRYVPLSTIRDRVTAAGKWSAFAAALDGLPSDKRWHLLTLTEGVAPDDADAIALLTAVGCDPAIILGV